MSERYDEMNKRMSKWPSAQRFDIIFNRPNVQRCLDALSMPSVSCLLFSQRRCSIFRRARETSKARKRPPSRWKAEQVMRCDKEVVNGGLELPRVRQYIKLRQRYSGSSKKKPSTGIIELSSLPGIKRIFVMEH